MERSITNFIPLHDHIFIRRCKTPVMTESKLLHIPDIVQKPPQEGIVKFVGPGRYNKSGGRTPVVVRPGDRVIYDKFADYYKEVTIGDVEYFVIDEESIIGRLEREGDKWKLTPSRGRLLIKRLTSETETIGGLVIPDAAIRTSCRARVLATPEDTNTVDAKVGDVIHLKDFSGTMLRLNGETVDVVRDSDVMMVIEASRMEPLEVA